jgi:hypothetical protein
MLNSQAVFIEYHHDSKFHCNQIHLLKQYWLSLCHTLTTFTKEIGHIGLPKDMSDLTYHYAHKYAGTHMQWHWLTVANLWSYYESIPARQMEALLLNQNCWHLGIKSGVYSLIDYLQQPTMNPEDIRLIFWIEKEK